MGNPKGHLVHGLNKHPLNPVWCTMKQRCENPNNRGYKWYGAKGIKVCEEWHDFIKFYEWAIRSGYSPGLTLDRIDPGGDYEPDNCRWITMSEQQRNKSSNHIVTYCGKSHSVTEWSEITGIPRSTLSNRLRLGWSIPEALGYQIRRRRI